MGRSGERLKASTAVRTHSAPRYQTVELGLLKPNPKNARKHSKRQIRMIAESYRAFGTINPIIVGPDFQILAGHGRYAAAKLEGLTQVAVLIVDGLTPAELRAYAIADNKLGDLSSFDGALLIEEIGDIAVVAPELDITVTGFVTAEIDSMVGAARTAELNDFDDPPAVEPGPAVSRLGDVWICGAHRLVCGDSTDRDTIATLVGDAQVRLVLSDVPYNLKIEGFASGLGRKQHADFVMASGEMSSTEFIDFLARAIGCTKLHLIDGAMLLLFIDWRHVTEMILASRKCGLELKNILVWAKDNAGMGTLWRSQHELIVALKHGKAPHVNNVELGVHGRYRSNVLQYPGMNTNVKGRKKALELHATVKPVALIADLILDVTGRGDVVLDPFGGSGTAMIAAEKVGRRALLSEIEPKFVDVTIERWNALGAEPARLLATGQTFDELRADREGAHG